MDIGFFIYPFTKFSKGIFIPFSSKTFSVAFNISSVSLGNFIINLPFEYSIVLNLPLGIIYVRIKTIISIINKIVYADGNLQHFFFLIWFSSDSSVLDAALAGFIFSILSIS